MALTLEEGRSAFERDDWRRACALLTSADQDGGLAPDDLERLATAAYLIGRDPDRHEILERAHHGFVQRGDVPAAARCAFWLGMALIARGETARGGGWLGRASRLVEHTDCVEQGFLLVPAALQHLYGGAVDRAQALFTEAAAIAERFDDTDLTALARLGLGVSMIHLGQPADGLALLDEVMVAVESGEVSPVPSGIIYCAVIEACHLSLDVRRAQEWTGALSRWCAAHPDLVPYRGQCLVHRAEILLFHGEWAGAMEEALQACERLSDPPGQPAIGDAHYQRAEVLRLCGDLDEAEAAYREASRWGRSPQPGLARLRVAQGRADAGVAAMRRVLEETSERDVRTRMLAAYVEVALAANEVETARAAADELAQIAAGIDTPLLRAIADHVIGAVLLIEGDIRGGLVSLRAASSAWRELNAPYEAARAAVLIGLACRELGDEDSAELEFDRARSMFNTLGAPIDLARLEELSPTTPGAHGLSAREVEVLRLVAGGRSNRAIADDLSISEHTVARHMQNIFTKLSVSSRTSAAAFAFEHNLV